MTRYALTNAKYHSRITEKSLTFLLEKNSHIFSDKTCQLITAASFGEETDVQEENSLARVNLTLIQQSAESFLERRMEIWL